MTDSGAEAESTAAASEGGISAEVTRAMTQTREAMKWLIVAFGAIATTLVAGSQLSELGVLEAWSDRWWTAVGGLLAALIGILAAVLGGLWILLPARSTLSDAARDAQFAEWMDAHPELLPPGETSVERFRRTYFAVRREYDQAMDAYEKADARGRVPAAVEQAQAAAAARWAEIEPWGAIVNDAATDHKFRDAARNGFVAIFLGGTLAALGIAAFAWGAHPEDDEEKPAAAAESPAAPVRVQLVLTESGEKVLREAAGCDLTGLTALQVGGTATAPDVLVLADAPCKAVRITLSESLGTAVRSG